MTQSTCNSYGNTTEVVSDYGTTKARTVDFTYEPMYQQVASITDQLGHAFTFHYDARGNPIGTTDPMSHDTTSVVQGGNVVSAADHAGNTHTFTYQAGDLVASSDPLGNTTTYFVDAAGRNRSVTDPVGRATTYTYDAFNHPKSVSDALGNGVQFNYDADGNLTSTIDRSIESHRHHDVRPRRPTQADHRP